MFKSVQMHLK